ncbi:MAG: hypothetical protein M3288_03210 [Thermoproteota archaeon]|jgi:hypothetical protein|nr:hypothetical protein [Thermoproteota archaeon]
MMKNNIFFIISIAVTAIVVIGGRGGETPAAYGQQELAEELAGYYDGTLSPENMQMLRDMVLEWLQDDNSSSIYVEVWEGGDLYITNDNGTLDNINDDFDITMRHNFTAANGYTFRDDQVFKPDGTPLFQP